MGKISHAQIPSSDMKNRPGLQSSAKDTEFAKATISSFSGSLTKLDEDGGTCLPLDELNGKQMPNSGTITSPDGQLTFSLTATERLISLTRLSDTMGFFSLGGLADWHKPISDTNISPGPQSLAVSGLVADEGFLIRLADSIGGLLFKLTHVPISGTQISFFRQSDED